MISVGFLSGCTENQPNESNEPEPIDTDGDGYDDDVDAFPSDPSNWLDSDKDGVGNNADAFPYDATETKDSDSDGVGDNSDAYPNNADEQYDSDNDGVGDNADAFPYDSTQFADRDGDEYGDNPNGINPDVFPDDPNEWNDTDGDSIGDNKDIYDYGNGGIKVRITRFEGDGSIDDDGSMIDPSFEIKIREYDDITEQWVTIEESKSDTYHDTTEITNPLTMMVDLDDDIDHIIIRIYAWEYDVIEGGSMEYLIDIYGGSNTRDYTYASATLRHQPTGEFSDDGRLDLEDELDGIIEWYYEVVEV